MRSELRNVSNQQPVAYVVYDDSKYQDKIKVVGNAVLSKQIEKGLPLSKDLSGKIKVTVLPTKNVADFVKYYIDPKKQGIYAFVEIQELPKNLTKFFELKENNEDINTPSKEEDKTEGTLEKK